MILKSLFIPWLLWLHRVLELFTAMDTWWTTSCTMWFKYHVQTFPQDFSTIQIFHHFGVCQNTCVLNSVTKNHLSSLYLSSLSLLQNLKYSYLKNSFVVVIEEKSTTPSLLKNFFPERNVEFCLFIYFSFLGKIYIQ